MTKGDVEKMKRLGTKYHQTLTKGLSLVEATQLADADIEKILQRENNQEN